MNNQEFAPFYVGQEVEAVRDHGEGVFKKGDRFTIRTVYKSPCLCKLWFVGVGIAEKAKIGSLGRCPNCKGFRVATAQWQFNSKNFRAITPAIEAVTFEKITEQHPVSVN